MIKDEVKVRLKAGDGGNGSTHFARRKYQPLGGPDGGDGGDGGDVLLLVDTLLEEIVELDPNLIHSAQDGADGGSNKKSGIQGKDLILKIPVGTIVYSKRKQGKVAELTADNESLVLLKGGRGGKGNYRFATAEKRTPHSAGKGEEGEAGEFLFVHRSYSEIALIDSSECENFWLWRYFNKKAEIVRPDFFLSYPRTFYVEENFIRYKAVFLPFVKEKGRPFRSIYLKLNSMAHLYFPALIIISLIGLKVEEIQELLLFLEGILENVELKNLKSLLLVYEEDISEEIRELQISHLNYNLPAQKIGINIFTASASVDRGEFKMEEDLKAIMEKKFNTIPPE